MATAGTGQKMAPCNPAVTISLILAIILTLVNGHPVKDISPAEMRQLLSSISSTGAKCDILLYIFHNRLIQLENAGLPKMRVGLVVRASEDSVQSHYTIDTETRSRPAIFLGQHGGPVSTTVELSDEGCVHFFSAHFNKIAASDVSVVGPADEFKTLAIVTKAAIESVPKEGRGGLYEKFTASNFKATKDLKSEPLIWYIYSRMSANLLDYFETRGVIKIVVRDCVTCEEHIFYMVFDESGPNLINNGDFDSAGINFKLEISDSDLVALLLDRLAPGTQQKLLDMCQTEVAEGRLQLHDWVGILQKYGREAIQFGA